MSRNKQIGLTQGPIFQTVMKLALPIMASAFLSAAYSITDMAWIGMLGSKAVAGVGVGGMYVWLSHGFSSLARMGGQVQAAQALGRGDKEQAKWYASAAIQMVAVFGILYGLVCIVFINPLIGFYNLDDMLTIQYAKIYMQITCGLIIFSYISNTLTGLYTAQGDSQTPLKANFIGLVTNMILDPVLILGVGPFPRLEVVGAALATVISQFIVLSVLVMGIVRNKNQENILRHMPLVKPADGMYYRMIAKIGIPTALQSSLYCFISMVLTRIIGNFGEGAIATQKVGGQIEAITWNTGEGFGAAMNAFAAQNYGAGKIERVKKGYRVSALAMVIWGALIGGLFVIFPAQISGIFLHEPEVIQTAVPYFIIVGLAEPLMCVELMAVGAISGLGNTKLCSVLSIVLTGLRIPLALVLSSTGLGVDGIWWALSLTSMIKGVAMHLAFGWTLRNELHLKTE